MSESRPVYLKDVVATVIDGPAEIEAYSWIGFGPREQRIQDPKSQIQSRFEDSKAETEFDVGILTPSERVTKGLSSDVGPSVGPVARSGDRATAQVDHAKGSPQNPMSDDEIISKFRANSGDVLDQKQQDRVIDLTWKFDEVENISDYMKLLV